MLTVKLPRVVIVTRSSEYSGLLARHGTREQARFFLETRGQSIEPAEAHHEELQQAIQTVTRALPTDWRRSPLERDDLDRFLFGPDDIVLVLGQDGLVANVAKYLNGQPVLGINPQPDWNAGVLVPHPVEAVPDLLSDLVAERAAFESRTMVEARLAAGDRLVALNEIFIGQPSHQSARYRLQVDEQQERHSSSGLIVSTGTGATGWARSIHLERGSAVSLPDPTDSRLAWFVREAWPSLATGTSMTQGVLGIDESLTVVSEMDAGVVFGDGIEGDRLTLGWGQPVTIQRAPEVLRLVL